MTQELGRLLVVFGIATVVVGALLWAWPQIPWLGRLPGDIHVERPGFRFSFPIVTCLMISVVVTVVLNLIGRIR